MNSNTTTAYAQVLAAICLSVAGCKSAPPKAVPARASLVVAADANPDAAGRPSPIVVRLYQLKEEGSFNGAAYFALMDKEHETLGASLVSREEYELQPGETRQLELKIPPDARYLAAVAGYRNLNNSKWKALSPAPETGLLDFVRKHKLTINVGRADVSIAAAK